MKPIDNSPKLALFFFIFLLGVGLAAQDYNFTPSSYTTCGHGNVFGSCVNETFIGNTILFREQSEGANDIEFRVRRCNFADFSRSGTAYIKLGDVCGTVIGQQSFNALEDDIRIFVPKSEIPNGTSQLTATINSDSGDRFHTRSITVTVTGGGCPEFVVTAASLDVTAVAPGGLIRSDFTVRNNGDAAGDSERTGIFLSSNTSYSASNDFRLDRESLGILNPGQSETGAEVSQIPLTTPPGIYYVLFVADYLDETPECSSGVDLRWVQIVVVSKPNLEVTSVGLLATDACQGGDVEVRFTVLNSGPASFTTNFNVGFYASSNTSFSSSIDFFLDSELITNNFSSGQSITFTRTISIPSSLNDTDWYMIANADYTDVIDEANEDDNWGSSPNEFDVFDSPSLFSPNDNETITTLTPRLDWSTDGNEFAVVVQTSSGTTVVAQNTGSNSFYDIPNGTLQANTTYRWQAAGRLANGEVCNSELWDFTTSCDDNYEPNDDGGNPATGVFPNLGAAAENTLITSHLSSNGDQDNYGFSIQQAGTAVINISNLPANYELELWGPNGNLATSTNTGTASEEISYQHPGGNLPVYVKVYGLGGVFDCDVAYRLRVQWFPNSNGGDLALSTAIAPAPSPLVNGYPATFVTAVRNNAAATWSGDIQFGIRPVADPADYRLIREYLDVNMVTGSVLDINYSTQDVSTEPGAFELVVQYSNDNGMTWLDVPGGDHVNPRPVGVLYPPIRMNQSFQLSDNPVIEGQPATFSVQVRNMLAVGFTGEIAMQLLNGNGAYITDLDIDNVNLPGNGNHTLFFTTTAITSAPGTYQLRAQVNHREQGWIDVRNNGFDNPREFTIVSQPDGLTITAPNGGETFMSGSSLTVTWNTIGTVSPISLELIDAQGTLVYLIADGITNEGTYTFELPACILTGSYRIKLYKTDGGAINDVSDGSFTVQGGGGGFSCSCDIDSPTLMDNDPELVDAAGYLCSEGIINDGDTRPFDVITRGELAKIVFIALHGNSDAKFSDLLPSPYPDLNNASLWFNRFAKNLVYLEYDDGETPFDPDFDNFRPYDPIAREDALKVILEAFDITETGFPPSPYADVTNSTAGYDYIVTAADLCLVGPATNFRPRDNALRSEIFLMVYRLKKTCAANNIPVPNPTNDDYFCPGNHTPDNLARSVGMAEGNFSAYAHTSFALPGVKLPLAFGFEYNSYLTELPQSIFCVNPLGRGWSHTYQSYAVPVQGWSQDGITIQDQIALVWPGGQTEVFIDNGGGYPRVVQPQTLGVYDQMTLVSATVMEVKTKAQTVFRYNKMNAGNGKEIYNLTNIIERNGHTINIGYESGVGGAMRIANVARQLGNANTARRTLTFLYRSGTNYLRSVSLGITEAGNSIAFFVNDNGDLKTFTDRRAKLTTYNYVRDINPNASEETIAKAEHLLYSILLPKGNTITNTYEKRKLNSMETNGELLTQIGLTFNYDQPSSDIQSTVTTSNSPGAAATSRVNVTFDKSTGRTKTVTTNGDAITYTFGDPLNPYLPKVITDDGLRVEVDYDSRGNPTNVKEILTAGNITHEHIFDYDTYNNLRSYTSPKGYTITNDFGDKFAEGLVQKVTDQEGYETDYTYFGANAGAWKVGGIESVTSPMGITLNYDYDGYGNPNSVAAPGDIDVSMTHDLFGRVQTYTNPNNYTWSYTYYANDILRKTTNPENNDVENFIDDNNNLRFIDNEAGQRTTLTYDPDTDLLVSKAFGGNTESYDYFDDGRLKKITKADNTVINITYVASGNGLGQVETDDYATYGYDDENRLRTVVKNNGAETSTITYIYDALDRVTGYTYSVQGGGVNYAYAVGYEYDLNGNVRTIQYPNLAGSGTLDVEYRYYRNDWLKEVEDWEGKITRYFYHDDGTVDYSLLPNGTRCTYTYDPVTRRLVGISDTKANGSVITDFDFVLDDLGNITEEDRTQPLQIPFLAAGNQVSTYANNNFTLTANGITQQVNANGNLTDDGTLTYDWDNYDMMTRRGDVRHIYDGHGMRRERRNPATGEAKRFVLDVMGMGNVIAETNAFGQPTAYYIHGAGLLYRKKPAGGGYNDSYYHYNFQGSTVAMTDEAQNVTHQYVYSPYGILWSKVEADENPFAFVGRYGVMRETDDFYYMRARFYSASQQRFISEDPVWSTNLYAYAGNNPIMNVDRGGEYIETALDVASAGLSLYDFVEDPSLVNGAFLVWDVVAIAFPVPGSYVAKGAKAFKGAKKSAKVDAIVAQSRESAANWLKKDGVVYRVPGNHTKSGLPYIGTTVDKKRMKVSSDGRDRKHADVIDMFDSSTKDERRWMEQFYINKYSDGPRLNKTKLGNKRNEMNITSYDKNTNTFINTIYE